MRQKKRKRRTKNEVDRSYKCVVEDCDKAYGYCNKVRELSESAH